MRALCHRTTKFDAVTHVGVTHVTPSIPSIRPFYWLPIRQRIAFKLAAVAYKTRQSGIPEYLHCDIRDYQPCRTLRSTSALLLQQPCTCHHNISI